MGDEPIMQGGYEHGGGHKATLSKPPPVGPNTRALVMPHASNVLGVSYDLPKIIKQARGKSEDVVVVVDGVAAAPHRYAGADGKDADFYVVSCHKLFGPHIGAVAAKRTTMKRIGGDGKGWERGTINFEACEGVIGLLEYFLDLSSLTLENSEGLLGRILSGEEDGKRYIQEAYEHVELAESSTCSILLDRIR